MKSSDIRYMQEATAADLAEFIHEDFGMNVAESLNALYNSTTYLKLMDPSTGLYFQSSRYVYSFLKNELTTGHF